MDNKNRILAAAERLFAEQGFDSTTVDQVAQEAGLTKGAVYYFFKNKADLFCQLIDPGLAYLEKQSKAIMNKGGEGDETARDLIGCFVDLAYEYEKIFRILLGSQTADPAVRRMFDQRINRLLRCVEALLYEGIAGNFLMPVSVTLYAKLIVGMIYGLIALPAPPAKETAVSSIQAVLRSLYR